MDALTRFLYAKDPLGTAEALQVTKAELEALLDEVHVASFGEWARGRWQEFAALERA